MEKKRNKCRFLAGKPEENRPLERPSLGRIILK
jgi:hypothetical protein